ncbi:MAG: hypothetical protein M3317_07215 [Actinomycetota bacterium]|nr:hypothetical protein [Actinomycetota bacterium]
MLGVILILASTFAYNGSAVLLAMAARQDPGNMSALLAVGRHASGLYGIASNLLGWVLEVAALTMLSLTLARVLNVSGLVVLLWLTRWLLKETLGRREILGAVLIAAGTAAAIFAAPQPGDSHPGIREWVVLLALLIPCVSLPNVLRLLHRPVGPVLGATIAGLAYALTGILTKGAAYTIVSLDLGSLVLLMAFIAGIGLLGFSTEIAALRDGHVTVVVPIVLALHTLLPIVCAPFLFGEVWPASGLLRTFLAGGIALATIGSVWLASSASDDLRGFKLQ